MAWLMRVGGFAGCFSRYRETLMVMKKPANNPRTAPTTKLSKISHKGSASSKDVSRGLLRSSFMPLHFILPTGPQRSSRLRFQRLTANFQFSRHLGHMTALVSCAVQLVLAGLTRTVTVGDC